MKGPAPYDKDYNMLAYLCCSLLVKTHLAHCVRKCRNTGILGKAH